MNFCDSSSSGEFYSPLTLSDLGISLLKEVRVRSESDIERELEFFEDPDYIPPPTLCSESCETDEMSSKETLSIMGSEEVKMLEYSDVSVEGGLSESERTEGGVARNEVVGVEAEGVLENILEVGDKNNKFYDSGADIVSEVKEYEFELRSRDSLIHLVETYEISSRVLVRPVGVKERACLAPQDHWMPMGDGEVEFLSTWKAKKANQNKYSLNSDKEEEVEKLVRKEGDIIDIMFLTNSDVIKAAELYRPSSISEEMNKFLGAIGGVAIGGVAIPKKPRNKSKTLENATRVKDEVRGDEVVEFVPQPAPIELDPNLREVEVPTHAQEFMELVKERNNLQKERDELLRKNGEMKRELEIVVPAVTSLQKERDSLKTILSFKERKRKMSEEENEAQEEEIKRMRESKVELKKNVQLLVHNGIEEHIGNFINSSSFDNIVNLYRLPTAILTFTDCRKKVNAEHLEVDITKITFGEQEERVEENGHTIFPPNFDFEFITVEEEEAEAEGAEVEESQPPGQVEVHPVPSNEEVPPLPTEQQPTQPPPPVK
ncbi:hypothetical protein SLEP1_g22656 [Rubroshorea leprosula]|uniref:Uncharacterized protein n=1 Tax=Rubroshorea leprosula TaxID=152421 RepID=A0AAV5J9V1_9ROSI|nr:hypothetical protein SLEP1_g22656 [Rubroshorea leprosula]